MNLLKIEISAPKTLQQLYSQNSLKVTLLKLKYNEFTSAHEPACSIDRGRSAEPL